LIAERGVRSAGVRDGFDIIEDHAVGLSAGGRRDCMKAFGF